jgi:hypothetical protein
MRRDESARHDTSGGGAPRRSGELRTLGQRRARRLLALAANVRLDVVQIVAAVVNNVLHGVVHLQHLHARIAHLQGDAGV